jgi:hypothetical protein
MAPVSHTRDLAQRENIITCDVKRPERPVGKRMVNVSGIVDRVDKYNAREASCGPSRYYLQK